MTTVRMAFPVCSTLVCLTLVTLPVLADEDGNKRSNVAAAFGRGLNTVSPPPGNPLNHAIVPKVIKVKAGGVVDFGVAGFHDIIVFKPGVTLDDLINAGGGVLPSFPPVFVLPPDPTASLPAAIANLVYYRGLNPAGGPFGTPSADNPDNDSNRREPVTFLEPGTYLVICNVRPHLDDGMLAHVKVSN